MPLIDRNLKSWWDDLWEVQAEGAWGGPTGRDQIDLHYHRYVLYPRELAVATELKRVMLWDNTTRLYVVGCGFGWILEALEIDLSLGRVIGNETSSYVQGDKTNNEDSDTQTAIEATGIPINTGDGLTLFTLMRGDGGARSKRAVDMSANDLTTGAGRRSERDRIGGPGFEILTYDGFLNTLSDSEAISYSNRLNQMQAGRVSHHVFPGWLNGHTVEEWKQLIPSDTFIEALTYRVL